MVTSKPSAAKAGIAKATAANAAHRRLVDMAPLFRRSRRFCTVHRSWCIVAARGLWDQLSGDIVSRMSVACLGFLWCALAQSVTATDAPPLDWIDPSTGHRVVRLSSEPGT